MSSRLAPTAAGHRAAARTRPGRLGSSHPAVWRPSARDVGANERQVSQRCLRRAPPPWVHCAPPCTFWSSLSRRTNHRSRIEDEDIRLQALVHIVFSLQLCRHQLRQKRWRSFEHPPTASSWNLDLLQELVASGTSQTGPTVVAGNNMLKMEKYIFDSCRWGHQDPGNGKLYRKRQCFASNADLSPLCLRCVCCVRHQVVEGQVDSGPRKGTRRSLVACEYPWAFCVAWADLIKSASGGT